MTIFIGDGDGNSKSFVVLRVIIAGEVGVDGTEADGAAVRGHRPGDQSVSGAEDSRSCAGRVHTVLVSVRLFLHQVVQPIESPFLKIERSPGGESHTASRSGK